MFTKPLTHVVEYSYNEKTIRTAICSLTPAATVTMLENCAMRSCRSDISSSRLRHDASVSLRASKSEEEEVFLVCGGLLLANMAGGGGREVVAYGGSAA